MQCITAEENHVHITPGLCRFRNQYTPCCLIPELGGIVGGRGYFFNIAHTLLIFKNNLDQLFIKTCVHFDLLVLLSSLTYHSIQNLCKINCTYSYVAWSMSLSVMEASAFNQKDAVDGMGVSLHVTCDVLTTGGTMILWESFIIFFAEWINYLCRFRNYVAFGTVSLFETLSHRNFWY